MPVPVSVDRDYTIDNITAGDLLQCLQNLIALHGSDVPVYLKDADTDWIMAIAELPKFDVSLRALIVRGDGYSSVVS